MKKVFVSLVSFSILGASVFAAGAFPADHLEDVTNGPVRGVSTTAETGGFAKTWYNEDGFGLHAGFHDLADPQGDDFYEGWLVRQSPFDFISTGELVLKDDGYYHDTFESSTDYSAYDFYVLTLEPNDGNPAPAEHIFEGKVIMADMMKDDKMMEKSDKMMKDDKMMKEMTPRQKALKMAIVKKLEILDVDMGVLLDRVMNFQSTLDSRNISKSKKAAYMELLDILIYVLKDKVAMGK